MLHVRSIKAFAQMMLYVMMMACSMLFMHRHQLDSGRVVVHIHPYAFDSDPSDNRNHTNEKEIETLDITFFHSYVYPAVVCLGAPIEILLTEFWLEPVVRKTPKEFPFSLSLRGPPATLRG